METKEKVKTGVPQENNKSSWKQQKSYQKNKNLEVSLVRCSGSFLNWIKGNSEIWVMEQGNER